MIKMEIVLKLYGLLNPKIKRRIGRKKMDKIKIFITYDITFWNNGEHKGTYKDLTNKDIAEELFDKVIGMYDNAIFEEVQERRTVQQYKLSES
jgi:hypothetical protein